MASERRPGQPTEGQLPFGGGENRPEFRPPRGERDAPPEGETDQVREEAILRRWTDGHPWLAGDPDLVEELRRYIGKERRDPPTPRPDARPHPSTGVVE